MGRARRNQTRAYRSATTGGDGRARIEGLAPGGYTLFALAGARIDGIDLRLIVR